MNILWLLRYPPFPPANGGDAVYSRQLVRHTAKVARVTALTFDMNLGSAPDGVDIEWVKVPFAKRSKLVGLLSSLPNVAYRHRQPAYVAKAIELAKQSNAVVVDHIGLFWMVATLRDALGSACPPLIVVNHDHEGSLRTDMVRGVRNPVFRQVLLQDGRKAARLELQANRLASGLTAITTTDQDAFGADAPGVPSVLLMPGYDGPVIDSRVIDETTPKRICILGGRGAFHKQLVLRLILDEIMRVGLQKRFIIDVAGGADGASAMAQAYPGVNFLGFVDDISAYMRTVRLGLIPDELGGGFKLRALTHAFLRVPMLALSKAMRGMYIEEGSDFIGVDSIEKLVETIPPLIEDVARLNRIQESAFARCHGKFDWADRARALVDFIERLPRTTP